MTDKDFFVIIKKYVESYFPDSITIKNILDGILKKINIK